MSFRVRQFAHPEARNTLISNVLDSTETITQHLYTHVGSLSFQAFPVENGEDEGQDHGGEPEP